MSPAARAAAIDSASIACSGAGLDQPGLGALLCCRLALAAQEADRHEMPLDDVADGREQARHVVPLHPPAAARIEHRLQLLDDEGHVAASAEHGADHARQRDRPSVVLEVFRVDEDLERAPAPVAHDVVDGDVHGVVAVGPAQLVGCPFEHGIALQGLGHVDDLARERRRDGLRLRRQPRAPRGGLVGLAPPRCQPRRRFAGLSACQLGCRRRVPLGRALRFRQRGEHGARDGVRAERGAAFEPERIGV